MTIDGLLIAPCNSLCRGFVGRMKKPTVTVTHVGVYSITISITPPADTDGSKIAGYTVVYGTRRVKKRIYTTTSTVTLDYLQDNKVYMIGVRVLDVGGRWGQRSSRMVVRTKIGIPALF